MIQCRSNHMKNIQKVIDESDVIVITAGAGMSADSGVATFRGINGVAETYPALKKKKVTYASLTTQHMFNKNPKLAWAFHGHCFNVYKNTIPHAGYTRLLELVKRKKDYFVVTSNVDGAFQKAGFNKDKVYEIHGRLYKFQCNECGNVWEPHEDTHFDVDVDTFKLNSPLPKCECGGPARPNFMMFNDCGFDKKETMEQSMRFNHFMHNYDKGDHKIAVIEFGAGESVPTIRMMGEYIHEKVKGATLIRVNPTDINVPVNALAIESGALDMISELEF